MELRMQSHFLNLYAMALSDVQITTSELEALYLIGSSKGIEKETIDNIILNPDKVQFHFPDSFEEKVEYLYDLVKVIYADGIVDPGEQRLLQIFAVKFGFAEEHAEAISAFLLNSYKEKATISEVLILIKENS